MCNSISVPLTRVRAKRNKGIPGCWRGGEVRDPQASTGVTRGCPLSFSSSSPFSLPFLQVTPVAGSPFAELPTPPASSKIHHVPKVTGFFWAFNTATPLPLPVGSPSFLSLFYFFSGNTSFITIKIISSVLFHSLLFFASLLSSCSLTTLLHCRCLPVAVLLPKTDFRNFELKNS